MATFRLAPDVHVSIPNGPALLASLNALAREQIPFAGSVTMKHLAEMSVRRAHGMFPKRFTMRRKALPKGITLHPKGGPPKREWPNGKVSVVVTERASFLADHELGARRRAKSGGRLAIPTLIVHQRERTATGKMKQRAKPASLPDAYEIDQTLRSNKSKLPAGLTIFYLLRKEARIEPRLKLHDDVETTVSGEYDTVFRKNLSAAIRSRKSGTKKYSEQGGRWRWLRERYREEGMVHR